MKKIFTLILTVMMIAAVGVPAFADTTPVTAPVVSENQQVYGQSVFDNNIKITSKTMKIKKVKGLSAKIKYPVISNMEDKAVQKALNKEILKEAKAQLALGRANIKELKDGGYKKAKCAVDFNYEVKYNSNGILSVVFTEYQYSGGAHGTNTYLCRNYDLTTGKTVELKDMMSDWDGAKTLINKVIRTSIDAAVKDGKLAEIETFKTIKDNEAFYFTKTGITVLFQQDGDYFPHAAGSQTYEIPYNDLNKYLNTDYAYLSKDVVILDSSKQTTLAVGQLGYIVVDSNATTGYTWASNVSDVKVVKVVKSSYMANPEATGLVGAPGKQVFIVKALAKGEAKLVCDYSQHWDGGTKGEATTYSITVK